MGYGLESSSCQHVMMLLKKKVRIAIRDNSLPPMYDIDVKEDLEFKVTYTEVGLYPNDAIYLQCIFLARYRHWLLYLL